MYTAAGDLFGEWALSGAIHEAYGIAIDPGDPSNAIGASAWVVDPFTDTVYEYNRDNGDLLGSFALATDNSRPGGIAVQPVAAGLASAPLSSEPAEAVRESSLATVAAPPLTSIGPINNSLFTRDARETQKRLRLDLTDAGFDVDDTTMYASPSEPTDLLPNTEPFATDPAIEELDLGPLDEQLVEDLAIALL
jgi:hypothetical protein